MINAVSVLKKMLITLCTLALLATAATVAAPAQNKAVASKSAPGAAVLLNQKDIHAAYNEGDFDKVVVLIDAFNQANKSYSRADSIFLSKHLAVVYSANPQTREKGKYFMYRLLEMMPSAELVDMFVSDEIDRIFDKVRKEFVSRQKGFGVDSSQISSPQNASTGSAATAKAQPASGNVARTPRPEPDPFWKRNAFWIASGAGVAIAGVAAIFIYYSDSPAAGTTIVVSPEP
jgi:hypothetical protein